MSIEKLSGAAREAHRTGIQEADRGLKNLLLSIGDGVVVHRLEDRELFGKVLYIVGKSLE